MKEIWLKSIMYAGVQMDILFIGNFVHYVAIVRILFELL